MGKIANTWSLMGASWQVLKKDKEIMVFPFLSGIASLIIIGSFVLPALSSGFHWHPPAFNAPGGDQAGYYAYLFLFYFCNYFVAIFFNAAIVACASLRMKGGDPTVLYGLKTAARRFPAILGWAFISSTVGVVLRAIQERSRLLGRIVAGLLGVSWSLASFLVVPILINQENGAIDALFESSALIKRTWSKQVAGNFSFGIIFFLLSIPAIAAIVGSFRLGGFATIFIIALAVEYLIILALVHASLQAIFQTAVYCYLQDNGAIHHGFTSDLLENSFRELS